VNGSVGSTAGRDDALAAELLRHGAATLGETGGLATHHRLKPAWAGARVAGPAYTVKLGEGDNLAIHVGCAEAPPGSVLVVDATEPPEFGYWGEVLTTQAVARGIAGLVIDGGCRDVAALEARGFPVFSSLVALRGAAKERGGSVGDIVMVGGTPVRPGDWVVGDVDGVTVVPGAHVSEIAELARTRTAKEQELFTALEAGATTIELLDLDPSGVRRGDGTDVPR
jgi:4-hydroxy-4-methyl-2-oxoglutarate aldolase